MWRGPWRGWQTVVQTASPHPANFPGATLCMGCRGLDTEEKQGCLPAGNPAAEGPASRTDMLLSAPERAGPDVPLSAPERAGPDVPLSAPERAGPDVPLSAPERAGPDVPLSAPDRAGPTSLPLPQTELPVSRASPHTCPSRAVWSLPVLRAGDPGMAAGQGRALLLGPGRGRLMMSSENRTGL